MRYSPAILGKAVTFMNKPLEVINKFSINYHLFSVITLISFLLPLLVLPVISFQPTYATAK